MHTGQIAPAAAGDPALGLIARCQQGTNASTMASFSSARTSRAASTASPPSLSPKAVQLPCADGVARRAVRRRTQVDFNIIDWGTLVAGT